MNPIAVAELTQLGTSLLSHGIRKISSSHEVASNDAFSHRLSEISSSGNLSSQRSPEELRADILKSDHLCQFLSQNSEDSLTLDKLADGTIRITSSSGDFLTLNCNSEIGKLASEYFDSCFSHKRFLSSERQNAVILSR